MPSSKGAEAGGAPRGPLQPFIYRRGRLQVLDQTQLPRRIRYLTLTGARATINAIEKMAVRGAPLIGVVAAYGLAVEARRLRGRPNLRRRLKTSAQALKAARPTAINLTWAIARLELLLGDPKVEEGLLPELLSSEASRIEEEERQACEKIGEIGAEIIEDGDRILTYCNAGRLATPGIGTALGVIYQARQAGKRIEVVVCETRPLLQGARLTATELSRAGIPTTLITDNGAAWVMEQVDKVIVGADRIALNGAVANKIGTHLLAIVAQRFGVPFYVAAPISTIDPNCRSGEEIPIEERDGREITHLAGQRLAPPGIKVRNPAFDVTPPELLTGIITEKGIIDQPLGPKIARLLALG